MRAQLQELEDQNGNQGCPNLDLQRIGASPHEDLDLEILLQRFEEQLDLPAIFVNAGDGGGAQGQMSGQQHQHVPGLGTKHFQASEEVGTILMSFRTLPENDLVFENNN